MVVNASNREKIVAWLHGPMAGRDVQLVDQTLDTAMIALQGPAALSMCQDITATDPATLESDHGYLSLLPKMNAVFIAWGPGIKPGAKLGLIENIDVAPTILEAAHLPQPHHR